MRLKKIFALTTIFLIAFLLFYPQTSQAASCKCRVSSSAGTGTPGRFGCVNLHPATLGQHFSDCEEFKSALTTPSEAFLNSVAVNAVLAGSPFNTADANNIGPNDVNCEQFSDETCTTPQQTTSNNEANVNIDYGLGSYTADLNKKPLLEINIPGLHFSNVVSNSNAVGTYYYIPWIPELISALYNFSIGIVSIVAVIVIILQGIRIVTSAGGEGKAAAYKKIGHAIIGLFIAWGSFAILYNINPATVEFNALKVQTVPPQNLPDFEEIQNTEAETVSPDDANEVVNDTPKFTSCPITLNNPLLAKAAGTSNKEVRTQEFYEKIRSSGVINGASVAERVMQIADAATKCGVRFGACGRTAGTIYTLAGVETSKHPKSCLNTTKGCWPHEQTQNIFSWPKEINAFSRGMSGCEAICADKTKAGECAANRVTATKLVMDALINQVGKDKLEEKIKQLRAGDAFWIYNANGSVCRGNHAMIFDKWISDGRAQVIQGMAQQNQNLSKPYSNGQVVYGYICITEACSGKFTRKPVSRIFRY